MKKIATLILIIITAGVFIAAMVNSPLLSEMAQSKELAEHATNGMVDFLKFLGLFCLTFMSLIGLALLNKKVNPANERSDSSVN
jgi:peptidoglycan biosynthesis protein MviN/MurJ (putative lipid II flippase)